MMTRWWQAFYGSITMSHAKEDSSPAPLVTSSNVIFDHFHNLYCSLYYFSNFQPNALIVMKVGIKLSYRTQKQNLVLIVQFCYDVIYFI